jgi:hypothetical protein
MTAPRRIPALVTVALLAMASAAVAYWRSFSRMVAYDDEGTMMLCIDRFFHGQVLFDSVRSIYGPFYYLYEWVAHAGSPVSHDVVRWASISWWITAGVVMFLLVWRATGSVAMAAIAQYVGFRNLSFIGLETAHPQEACITLLLAVGLVGAWTRAGALRWFVFGALAGAIAMCKINLAIFVIAALGVVFALALPPAGFGRVVRAAAIVMALALAPLLMLANLGSAWALKYALLISVSVGAALAACARYRIEPATSWRDAAWMIAGLAASISAIAVFPLSFGSTVHGMWYSLVIYPSSHFAQSFTNPLVVRPVAQAWMIVNLGLAIAWWRRGLPDWVIVTLKLLFAVMVVVLTVVYGLHELIGLGTPMLWLCVAVPGERISLTRPLLAVLGVLQVMYAYPVAGAQGSFVTVIFVAIAAIDVYDTLPWLAARMRVPVRLVPAAVALALAGMYMHDMISASGRYRSLEALGLPGAMRLRIEPDRAADLRRIVTASRNCSMLVSEPGLFSLNLLSRTPAPDSLLAGGWMLFYGDDQQKVTVKELESQPRPCAVVNPEVVKFWAGDRDISGQPLVRYIHDELRPVFQAGDYEFRAR